MMRLKIVRITNMLFSYSVAAIFAYFGFLAITDPVTQTQLWVAPEIYSIIIKFVQVEQFIQIFGFIQVGLAALIFANRFLKIVYPIVAMMLVGIIVTVGFNEVAYRDTVILFGVLYLWSQEL